MKMVKFFESKTNKISSFAALLERYDINMHSALNMQIVKVSLTKNCHIVRLRIIYENSFRK